MHTIRAVLCSFVFLGTAPALHAQGCSWEADLPRRESAAREVLARSAIIDSIRAGIVAAARAAGVEEPRGLVAISSARPGAAPAIRAFDANFSPALLEGLRVEAGERMKRYPVPRGTPIMTLVRLDTLPLPAARADGKRLECTPSLLNRMEIARELQEWRESPEGRREFRQDLTLGMVVDRAGRVRHAELLSRGAMPLENLSLRLAERAMFRVASLDGVPRDVWVTLPISIR